MKYKIKLLSSNGFHLLSVLICSLLSACIASPSKSFQHTAEKFSFKKIRIESNGFELTAYSTNSPLISKKTNKEHILHVYLGGDGQPWIQRNYISKDPTSRKATVLHLMNQDNEHSLYLGRPCYHLDDRKISETNHQQCQGNHLWTSHRYSETIVSAMEKAISEYQKTHNSPNVTLIGFSGGGTIATLLANRLKNIDVLVTINANLNIDAWTQHHGYSPLFGSINPYTQAVLPTKIHKHHLIGMQDRNVLSEHWLDRFQSQSNTTIHRFDEFGHRCCWKNIWPNVLKKITAKPGKSKNIIY